MADIQFNLRIPEELKDKIKDAASQSGRSINAEAQMRLEESFTVPQETSRLLQEAVLMTLDAVKKDPTILNNPNVTVVAEPPLASPTGPKNTVQFEHAKSKKK
ncbi:Arc family DNA-binding protein [Acinetobacter soli]|uniref:Arc family DNA-binding protein n=1 Tax=Acinetobacter soli TaxID=487316 RepID=UPI001250B71E|nr:Arc family DNA-binding protein [Acinetobacter soli]WEH93052.1 Arc family DNA-binding protein [Acinetobacter soli]WEH97758.1 Arc family DNA-binding protein [Acinetobacter soli]WEI01673.1 Arc family DNA-binding protein [Acinetobacter soli]